MVPVSAELWEWAVDHGAGSAPMGVCGARHRAVELLTRSLARAGGPACGHLAPVALVDAVSGFAYERLSPVLTASYEKGAITWKPVDGR